MRGEVASEDACRITCVSKEGNINEKRRNENKRERKQRNVIKVKQSKQTKKKIKKEKKNQTAHTSLVMGSFLSCLSGIYTLYVNSKRILVFFFYIGDKEIGRGRK